MNVHQDTVPQPLAPDLWGGAAAALVALPAAVAFGVAILSPLGPEAAARGAAAGLVGAAALGLIAPLTRGHPVLISAPSAPAAAVLGALAAEMAAGDASARGPERLLLVALMSAVLQILFALSRSGRLMKYIPHPVVSGYLTGVGGLIILAQLPHLLGLPRGARLLESTLDFSTWRAEAVAVGVCAGLGMVISPRLTRRVPASVTGLAAGVVMHVVCGFRRPEIWAVTGNPLVVGAFSGASLLSTGASLMRELALFFGHGLASRGGSGRDPGGPALCRRAQDLCGDRRHDGRSA